MSIISQFLKIRNGDNNVNLGVCEHYMSSTMQNHIALSSISGSFNICHWIFSVKKRFVVKGVLEMFHNTSPFSEIPRAHQHSKSSEKSYVKDPICFGPEFPQPIFFFFFCQADPLPLFKFNTFWETQFQLHLINKGSHIKLLKTELVLLFCFPHRHV